MAASPPADTSPVFPEVSEVADGLYRLLLPLSYDPRSVNAYLEVGADGTATLFDTGTDDEGGRDALARALESLGLDLGTIRDVIVTHAHVDHYGLAGWLATEYGATVHMHQGETMILERHWRTDWWIAEYAAYMRRHGVEPGLARRLAELEDWRYTLSPLSAFAPIEDGDRLTGASGRDWRVVHTPGHSSGHVSLWNSEESVLIGGDHILAVYSPHLRHVPDEMTDPLASYLWALGRVERLGPTLTLPGHGEPITDTAAVVEQLRNGHAEVLSEVRRAVQDPRSGADVTRALHGSSLPDFHLRLALPQTMVYLRHLEMLGEARPHLEGGVIHYRISGASGQRTADRRQIRLEEALRDG